MTQGDKVEAIARGLGWWRESVDRSEYAVRQHVVPMSVCPDGEGFIIVYGDEPHAQDQRQLTPPEALLLLHLARLGPTRDRCPDCAGTKRVGQHGDRIYPVAEGLESARPCPTCTGPAVECEGCERGLVSDCETSELAAENLGCGLRDDGKKWHVLDCVVDDCEGCSGKGKLPGKPTGWVTREHGWAERWLRARPQPIDPDTRRLMFGDNPGPTAVLGGCGDVVSTTHAPGDPEAREQITVLSDQLQDNGDSIGDVLALWLSGAPCSLCKGRGAIYLAYDTTPTCDCRLCGGAGKAYAAQLIEASP